MVTLRNFRKKTVATVPVQLEVPGKKRFRQFRFPDPVLSGLQKGPAERGHVKKSQKSSKSVKKFFDTFRQFSRRAKNVKNRQKVSKSFSTLFDNFRAGHLFSGPFCNPLMFGSCATLFLVGVQSVPDFVVVAVFPALCPSSFIECFRAQHRGRPQFYFIFTVLRTLFLVQRSEPLVAPSTG